MGDTEEETRDTVNASPSSSQPAVDADDDDMFEDAVEEEEEVPPEAMSPKRVSREDTSAPGHKGWVSQFEDPFYEDSNVEGSLILSILKNVRPGQEFDHMLAPTQMLQAMSMLEKVSYLYFHGNVLFGMKNQESPELRFKQFVQWYCSWLYTLPVGTRKPYNPVLGEIYRCKWDHGPEHGTSHYIGEQVSHHPAISGFYFSNRKEEFVINGELKSRLRFYGNTVVNRNEGFGVVCLLNKKESYRFESPDLKVGGLFLGTAYVDYDGKADLYCPQTNMSCKIEFNKKKSMFSRSKRRALDAQIIFDNPETGRKEVLYEIEGSWDESIQCTNTRTGETETLFDTATWKSVAPDRIPDPPLEEQWPMESQVVWKDVSVPLRKKEWDNSTDQKKVVEDYQRKLAKERKDKSIKWRGRLYTQNEKNEWIAFKLNNFEPYKDGEDIDKDQKVVVQEKEKWTDELAGRVGDEDETPYTPVLVDLFKE